MARFAHSSCPWSLLTTTPAATREPPTSSIALARPFDAMIRSTSESVAYVTPSLRPASTSASVIAWLPPTAIAAGSNDSVSGRQWISPCSPGTSSGKQPVEVVAARMNRICSSMLSKKSWASWRSVMN